MANNVQPVEKDTPTPVEAADKAAPTPANDDAAAKAQTEEVAHVAARQPEKEKPEDFSMMSSEKLRKLRESFEKAMQPMQDQIRELNNQISAAEHREHQEKCDAQLRELVPGDDNTILNKHKFIFLINNSSEGGGHEEGSFLRSAVGAAWTTANRLGYANVDRKTVSATFWGVYGDLRLDPRFDGRDYSDEGKPNHKFLTPAKKILDTCTPDSVDGKKQNYIVLCEGAVEDNIDHSVAVLQAAARLNPKATFDFIVCNAAETAMDKLVQKFTATEDGKNANLIKVAKPEEIAPAVMAALKARMEDKVYTPPAPPVPVQQKAETANKPVTAPSFRM